MTDVTDRLSAAVLPAGIHLDDLIHQAKRSTRDATRLSANRTVKELLNLVALVRTDELRSRIQRLQEELVAAQAELNGVFGEPHRPSQPEPAAETVPDGWPCDCGRIFATVHGRTVHQGRAHRGLGLEPEPANPPAPPAEDPAEAPTVPDVARAIVEAADAAAHPIEWDAAAICQDRDCMHPQRLHDNGDQVCRRVGCDCQGFRGERA